jgi:hypothetical protein
MKTQANNKPLNNSKLSKETIEYICPYTGVILHSKQEAEDYIKDLIEHRADKGKDVKKTIKLVKETFGLDKEIPIPQRQRYYKKVYRGIFDIMCKTTPSTFKLFVFILDNVDFRDNCLIVDNRHPTQEDIYIACDMSLKTLKRCLRELTELNIITIEKHRQSPKLYLNPYYVESGMTTKDIHDKFNK